MASKDILIYGSINEETSAEFIEDINEALYEDPATEIVVRINSNGGSPEYTWGMIAKFNELTGIKKVKNDGKSYSMGLFFNCYVENASALDVSNFLLHRAAYPQWIEQDPEYFNQAMRENLAAINKSLRAAFEAKVDVAKFEKLKGVTLDEVFSMESRIDVNLTAAEAKKIGLINEIVVITPQLKAEIEANLNNYTVGIAAKYTETKINNPINNNNPKKSIMTIETLKAEHPAVYAQALALGVEQEKDRVGSIMAFNDIDPEAVKKAIASGKFLSETEKSELAIKAIAKLKLTATKEESAPAATTTEEAAAKPEAEIKADAFMAEVKKNIN